MFFGQADADDLAAALSATGSGDPNNWSWYDVLGTQLSNQFALEGISIRPMNVLPYPRFDYVVNVPGGQTDNILPAQIALVASLHTGLGGRSNRGRIYFSGWTEENNTADGVASSTARDQARLMAQAWSTPHTFGGDVTLELGVFSRKLATMPYVSSVTVDSRWDVQRRRANRRIF
jgi:hypothetical protein